MGIVSQGPDEEGPRFDTAVISPGKTIGVLGGGQLGRMFSHAAQALGYRVFVYDPSGNGTGRGCCGQTRPGAV